MEPKTKSTIGKYILLLVAVINLLLITIVVFAVISIRNMFSSTDWMLISLEKVNVIQDARMTFEETRRLGDNLLLHSGDYDRINELADDIYSKTNSIRSSIDTFRSISINPQEHEKARSVSAILSEYNALLSSMIAVTLNGDYNVAEDLLSLMIPQGREIANILAELSDMSLLMMEDVVYSAEYSGDTSITLLITVSVLAIIVIAVVSVCVLLTVNKKLSREQGITMQQERGMI